MAIPPHVLLLNASADESDMYAFWLESCGYRVTVTQDLQSARRVTRKETVDVLVVDALFAGEFRRAEFERHWNALTGREPLATVVLLGFLTDAELRARHGAHEVRVLKPCLPEQLSSCIEHLLWKSPHDRAS